MSEHSDINYAPIVEIQQRTEDLYNLSLAIIGNGGSIVGYGMGRPYLEPSGGESLERVKSGMIASISAIPMHKNGPEDEVEPSRPLDFVAPLGVTWVGLAMYAANRNIHRSVYQNGTDHFAPVYDAFPKIATSVLAVDTITRRKAQNNPYFMPQPDDILEIIPSEINGSKEGGVAAPLYLDSDNQIKIEPSKSSIQVGEITFASRKNDGSVPLTIDEIFNRADWHITSNRFSGYLLQILTGSKVKEIDIEDVVDDEQISEIHSGNFIYKS